MKFRSGFYKVLSLGSCIYCVKRWGVSIVICCGESMEPVINDGDIVLVDNYSFRRSKYDPELIRNKVVILDSPTEPDTFLCKRVVATADDTSWFRRIPKGYVYVQGDNRSNSHDSDHYGPVPLGLVKGIVVYKIYPYLRRVE